jgi:tetratricopeptide (TPR) repeat protein
MSKQTIGCLALVLVALCITGLFVYQLPPVYDRVGWRVDQLRASILYAIKPPEQVEFEPVGETLPGLSDQLPTATPTPAFTNTPIPPGPTDTPTATPTVTLTPTPIPGQALLSGFTHMYQSWNNCGPANLAMALTYWGWEGDQRDTAAFLKPNARDRNVMPYEMQDYVQTEAGLGAAVRVGGDLQTLKAFVAAGIPVIVEKGFEGVGFDGWMGHYEVVNGYDDAAQVFYVQDSYKGPDLEIPYDELSEQWRAFNNTYIVVYPPEREAEVLSILGPQSDPDANFQFALQKAIEETGKLNGRDQFFARFNQGSNLVALHDYQAGATAFDAAFANYNLLAEGERPWRMMWYQTGPYFAYYYTGRYQDVIDLANTTLGLTSEPNLEESYYWRGRARLALGDVDGAIQDFQASLKHHKDFQPALEQLGLLGVTP